MKYYKSGTGNFRYLTIKNLERVFRALAERSSIDKIKIEVENSEGETETLPDISSLLLYLEDLAAKDETANSIEVIGSKTIDFNIYKRAEFRVSFQYGSLRYHIGAEDKDRSLRDSVVSLNAEFEKIISKIAAQHRPEQEKYIDAGVLFSPTTSDRETHLVQHISDSIINNDSPNHGEQHIGDTASPPSGVAPNTLRDTIWTKVGIIATVIGTIIASIAFFAYN